MKNLETLQRYYDAPTLFAQEWQSKGGKVVGYFCNTVPEELIMAAGFLPLRITGRPGVDIRKAASLMGPGEGYAHSMLSRLLDGEYAFLDYLVVPHSRSSVHKMYSVLEKLRREKPELPIPELWFLDHTHSTFMTSQLFNRDRLMEFKGQLELWAGKPIPDEALQRAIDLCNESRDLLKKLAALRADPRRPVLGSVALQIIGSAMFMDKETHNALLRSVLEEAETAPAGDKVRLFLSGGPQDHLGLYRLLEECGAVVVAEDHCWGNRWSDDPVVSGGDPMDAIIRRYNNKAPCASTFPMQRRVDYCVDSAAAAHVQGAVFYCLKNDPQAWDIPDERKALEAKGIPTLSLIKQKYGLAEAEEIKGALATFLATCRESSQL